MTCYNRKIQLKSRDEYENTIKITLMNTKIQLKSHVINTKHY